MANYSFEETIYYFAEKANQAPHEEDIAAGVVEIMLDRFPILITKGKLEGGLLMETLLGLYVKPFNEERLKELATSNFFNINTGGCTLALDEVSIMLKCYTTPSTPPEENWEWMHRILTVAREWHKVLLLWEEFIPLFSPERPR